MIAMKLVMKYFINLGEDKMIFIFGGSKKQVGFLLGKAFPISKLRAKILFSFENDGYIYGVQAWSGPPTNSKL